MNCLVCDDNMIVLFKASRGRRSSIKNLSILPATVKLAMSNCNEPKHFHLHVSFAFFLSGMLLAQSNIKVLIDKI